MCIRSLPLQPNPPTFIQFRNNKFTHPKAAQKSSQYKQVKLDYQLEVPWIENGKQRESTFGEGKKCCKNKKEIFDRSTVDAYKLGRRKINSFAHALSTFLAKIFHLPSSSCALSFRRLRDFIYFFSSSHCVQTVYDVHKNWNEIPFFIFVHISCKA